MDEHLEQSGDHKFIPMTSVSSGTGKEVRPDVYYYTNQIVNVVFIGDPATERWLLVDAGMPKCGDEVIEVAEKRFGKGVRPLAILLTHGHFDHVGSIVRLIEEWNVPVYAHPLELPYLTGRENYPEPDPTVDGGLLAKLSFIYPHQSADISAVVQPLLPDGGVPFLPDWKWIHTPGHTPGHVSFFRQEDGLLLSGDAFITVRQDALYKVLVQKEEVNGPPRYLTTDWNAARSSVTLLAGLKPATVISGHGTYMEGAALEEGLDRLVQHFDDLALPKHGRYVDDRDDD